MDIEPLSPNPAVPELIVNAPLTPEFPPSAVLNRRIPLEVVPPDPVITETAPPLAKDEDPALREITPPTPLLPHPTVT